MSKVQLTDQRWEQALSNEKFDRRMRIFFRVLVIGSCISWPIALSTKNAWALLLGLIFGMWLLCYGVGEEIGKGEF